MSRLIPKKQLPITKDALAAKRLKAKLANRSRLQPTTEAPRAEYQEPPEEDAFDRFNKP